MVQGTDGSLYGTTFNGGAYGGGTVFKLNTNGSGFAVLYSFGGASGGLYPSARLMQGADGALYGTTQYGGSTNDGAVLRLGSSAKSFWLGLIFVPTNYGTVFRLSANGSDYSVLHRFTGTEGDGSHPGGALVQGADGMLFGTTGGGGFNNAGTVFKLSTNGSDYSVLHRFTGTEGDGAHPASELVRSSDDALYGTTANGGTNNFGTVFKLSTSGSGYSVIHNFTGREGDGAVPLGGLIRGADGGLYGTTEYGGNSGSMGGTVFRLSPSLSGSR